MSPDGPPPAPADVETYRAESGHLRLVNRRTGLFLRADLEPTWVKGSDYDALRARLTAAEATRHQVEQDRDKAVEEARMGHVRLNECAGWEATKDQPLYDRISAKIQQLVNDKREVEHMLSASANENDALRAEKNAAEHRRQAAEYRAQRIVLDKELLAERDALIAQLAALRKLLERLLREATDAPAVQMMDGNFYRTVPTLLVEELRTVLAEERKDNESRSPDGEQAHVADERTIPSAGQRASYEPERLGDAASVNASLVTEAGSEPADSHSTCGLAEARAVVGAPVSEEK